MTKVAAIFRPNGMLIGYISVATSADLELNVDRETQIVVELPVDHPAQYEQDKWEFKDGIFQRKSNG